MNIQGTSRRGGRRQPMAEINVIPYIDVCLVLLIIFMVTAPMLQSGVDVDLPQAEAKTLDTQETLPIIVSIRADGAVYVDVSNSGDVQVSDDELIPKISAAVADKPGIQVLIRGDESVAYGRVVTVMASIKQAGIPSVGLMTRPPEE